VQFCGDFLHVQYAFYLHALDARRAVKCGMASVTWCDVTANHRRTAHSIPHFTFHILHAAVPHFTHSRGLENMNIRQWLHVRNPTQLNSTSCNGHRCEHLSVCISMTLLLYIYVLVITFTGDTCTLAVRIGNAYAMYFYEYR